MYFTTVKGNAVLCISKLPTENFSLLTLQIGKHMENYIGQPVFRI